MGVRDSARAGTAVPLRLLLASSNPGKLREYRELAGSSALALGLIPNFPELPPFDESAPTFAENAAGKALHYSRFTAEMVLADDSGLVVPALAGAPGVRSARYAGPDAADADCVRKLLREMEGREGNERRARFVCVIVIARQGRVLAVVSDFVEGLLAKSPRGTNGFGYDPVFLCRELGRTFAELSSEEKNSLSHRAKAFRKLRNLLAATNSVKLSSPGQHPNSL
ncbi:MAG TPA: RdgB/HAM1 family non-canonical purine NTP pyrophosphatase [Candidatus Polarisedimenticolia bacterium]|nr:RdgB/HAM1 family non-canonical purine NTP pyrophosphatase [Candidatus Polarisedimenticolia bacterium]